MPKVGVKYGHNIDLQKNQIINVVIDQLAAAPSAPKEGQVYYDTAEKAIFYWDGTEWVPLGVVEAGEGLVSTDVGKVRTLDLNVDNVTIEIDNDVVRIKDQGVSTAKIKDNNVTTIKVADNAITFAKMQDLTAMTVIGSLVGGDPEEIAILDEDDFNSDSATALATQQSIKAYVDKRIADVGVLQGGFDAAANADLPGDANTNKGDYWYVTVPGTAGSTEFNVGDVIIANQDAPTGSNPNHYVFLETNRDQATTTILGLVKLATNAMMDADVMTDNQTAVTPAALQRIQAKESKKGIAEIATQAETDAGTDDTRMITPLKLKTWYDAKSGAYLANVGNGAATSFALTHNLNSLDVSIDVHEIATGEDVQVAKKRDSVNQVTVTFGDETVPGAGAYRVKIKKIG